MSDTENESLMENNENEFDQNLRRRTKYPVDFSYLLYFFSYTFTGTVLLNQISYQVCTVILKYNTTVCERLESSDARDFKIIEDEIQRHTTTIKMSQQIIENVLPAFLSFLFGPWSDKFGRKPLMLSASIGSWFFFVVTTIITVLARYYEVNPWYYVIGSIGLALSGGVTAIIISMYAYIADTSSEEDRDKRMGFLEGALYVGLFLGSISTSYVFKWTNSTIVFGIAAILQTVSILYLMFFVVESREVPENAPKGCMNRFRELFKAQLILDAFRTCFKKREKFDRAILWLIIGSLIVNMIIINGYSSIAYFFTRKQFSWHIKDFTLYESVNIAVQCFGLFLLTPLLIKIKIPTLIIALAAFLSYFVNFLAFGFAKEPFVIYISIFLTFLRALVSPIGRALISKVIHTNDVGKAYSILTSCESLAPLLAAPLFAMVYQKTLSTCPQLVMFVAAGIILIGAFNMICVIVLKWKYYTSGFAYEEMPVNT